VAVKELSRFAEDIKDSKAWKEMQHEVHMLGTYNHPNIMRCVHACVTSCCSWRVCACTGMLPWGLLLLQLQLLLIRSGYVFVCACVRVHMRTHGCMHMHSCTYVSGEASARGSMANFPSRHLFHGHTCFLL